MKKWGNLNFWLRPVPEKSPRIVSSLLNIIQSFYFKTLQYGTCSSELMTAYIGIAQKYFENPLHEELGTPF